MLDRIIELTFMTSLCAAELISYGSFSSVNDQGKGQKVYSAIYKLINSLFFFVSAEANV